MTDERSDDPFEQPTPVFGPVLHNASYYRVTKGYVFDDPCDDCIQQGYPVWTVWITPEDSDLPLIWEKYEPTDDEVQNDWYADELLLFWRDSR